MRVLVTGANGQVGSEVIAEIERRNASLTKGRPIDVLAAGHDALDVAKRDEVMGALYAFSPDLVIHLAAFTGVDRCEQERDLAFAVNALGTRNVVDAARRCGARVAYVSTDYVFDGELDRPYDEWDVTRPISVYGASKLAGEDELDSDDLVVRTSWIVGRIGSNFVKTVVAMSREERPLRFVDDQRGCPTIASDLAPMLLTLALEGWRGCVHVTNQGPTTWFEFAREIVGLAGGDPDSVRAISSAELDPPRAAQRPKNSVLDNAVLRLSGIDLLPEWRESTAKLVADLGA
ncbi:MAG: dTDP-4-dehydrorhamnose reductase [Acidimicrobiales bacterium]